MSIIKLGYRQIQFRSIARRTKT